MMIMEIDKEIEAAFVHENNFYVTCDNSRIGKFIAHYELFKRIQNLQGALVECGVFKGISLLRFATFRKLLGDAFFQPIIAFDSFGEFPDTKFEADKKLRKQFIESAGSVSISQKDL